jgi:hypothetical protein
MKPETGAELRADIAGSIEAHEALRDFVDVLGVYIKSLQRFAAGMETPAADLEADDKLVRNLPAALRASAASLRENLAELQDGARLASLVVDYSDRLITNAILHIDKDKSP